MSNSIREAWEQARQKLADLVSGNNNQRAQSAATPKVIAELTPNLAPITASSSQEEPAGIVVNSESSRVHVKVSDGARFSVNFAAKNVSLLAKEFELAGQRLQIPDGNHREDRELTLGLDFGTSCTKVIIGDAAAGKSFAVPFLEAAGIDRYLLASRVFETDGEYSLQNGSVVHRDLKLAFMRGEGGLKAERNVVAYLALVIRRARGWLLKEQHDVYRNTRIYWRLAIGLPTQQNFDRRLSDHFRVVALASWYVAGSNDVVSRNSIDQALAKAGREHATTEDVDIRVMPEIAAQIYGFVVSDSFDRNGRNIFLITDVGSGTVDASLFYVREERGRRHSFSVYTSTVDSHGVANLHRHRVRWWKSTLRTAEANPSLVREMEESMATTDHDLRIPEDFRSYFDGVRIDCSTPRTPDDEFFGKVEKQVVTNTFIRAIRDNQVPRHQLVGVPFYLCGGGSRMAYYGRLKQRLERVDSAFGVSAIATPLVIPGNLEAKGIADDYDRLSVAYGLGWLDPGFVVETEPMSSLDADDQPGWRTNFVDKDQM